MANCHEMKPGNLFFCKVCGLELEVKKACGCKPGEASSCTVPLQCCGQDMTKR